MTPTPVPTPTLTPTPMSTPTLPAPTPVPGTNNKEFDYEWKGLAVTEEFKQKVLEIAYKLDTDPDNLMAVMSFESGFTPLQ